jgi:CBS domain-containing protein
MSSEFEDAYTAEMERDEPLDPRRALKGAILTDEITELDAPKPVLVQPETPVAEAIRIMNEAHIGCVLVERGGKLAGIFTERDVLRRVVGQLDPKTAKVAEVMTADPEALYPDDGIATALNRMAEGSYRHIPLVDRSGKPVGVVSVKDFVRYIVSLIPDAAFDVPPDPHLKHPDDPGGAG